jgi:hypothetical protein
LVELKQIVTDIHTLNVLEIMNNHYKNNGELCCQICLAYMTEEEYDCGGGECADCRDEGENEFAQV